VPRGSATRRSRATWARSRSAPGKALRTIRPNEQASTGSSPRAGCPTNGRPSSPLHFPGTCPVTARSAAEVLTGFTGSPYFPGGLWESRQPRGSLDFTRGPSRDVVLQAATYYDAADEAGVSRIYSGIHVSADDFAGRRIGSVCGKQALALARRYFGGSARS